MVFRYYFNFERDSFGYLMLKLPSKIRLFSHFIELIATEDRANEFIQIIDEVKEGKHEEYEIFFNAPTVLIRPEITSVSLSHILDDDAFYDTYQKSMVLEKIWFFKDEYKEENKNNYLLGHLIVFALDEKDYIMQLDFKENLDDHLINIKNYWPDAETKLVQFILVNDQQYYTYVPAYTDISNIYEVPVKEVGRV